MEFRQIWISGLRKRFFRPLICLSANSCEQDISTVLAKEVKFGMKVSSRLNWTQESFGADPTVRSSVRPFISIFTQKILVNTISSQRHDLEV